MAITKVSQLARLSNSILIQALTNRSFNDFGQMLGPDDIFEVSYKNHNKPGYYSVGASLSDIRFDLVGKYSLNASTTQENQSFLKPILTYDSEYANRYKEGDLLFYPKQNGLTLIRKTNTFDNNNGTAAPEDDNIAPYGLLPNALDPNKAYQWQYAVLPWDSWMVPLFSTIKTVGKIVNGYWQEVRPYKLFPESIFTAAHEELQREFDNVINDRNPNKRTINNFNNINSTTPSANSIYTINITGVSGVYNFDTDRYILKIDSVGKTNNDISGILSEIATACGSDNTNIKMPFFAFTVNATPNNSNYISVPYYTLSSTEPNSHVYCCLGNTVSADTSSYNISPVWAYEMIKNKETKLSSNTLNINNVEYETSSTRTGINIKTPANPLSINDSGELTLNIGNGLTLYNNELIFDDSALQALSDRVTNLDNDGTKSSNDNISAINDNISAINDNISAVNTRITTEVESLNGKIDDLETTVNITINTELGRINEEIDKINTELERINALITTNNNKLQTTLYGEASLG